MKQEARVRIVRRFIALLASNDYKYIDDATTERLVMLIYTAMYSLSRIQTDEWHKFLILFKEAKSNALAKARTVEEKIDNYNCSVLKLRSVFEKYIHYIETLETQTKVTTAYK